jgi:hypothetical protein
MPQPAVLIPVESSNLAAVGYDEMSHRLTVSFKSGTVYQYYAVPLSIYRALMASVSLGSFFARHIKTVYPYRRIT